MMFAHGFGCDQNMWRFITPAFETDYKIVAFDYVGAGGSDLSAYRRERYSTLSGYARDVLDIIEALDLHDLVFVGHSVSGMIGLLAAIEQPQRFAKMIMVGPSPCYINDGDYVGGFGHGDIEELLKMMEKNYMGWSNSLAPVIMKNPDRPELAQELEASFCSTDPVIAQQFARATFLSDNRSDLQSMKIPALILQCAEDLIAPAEVGTYLHTRLPNSSLVQMKATGHCPHMSHPEETIALMRRYLDG